MVWFWLRRRSNKNSTTHPPSAIRFNIQLDSTAVKSGLNFVTEIYFFMLQIFFNIRNQSGEFEKEKKQNSCFTVVDEAGQSFVVSAIIPEELFYYLFAKNQRLGKIMIVGFICWVRYSAGWFVYFLLLLLCWGMTSMIPMFSTRGKTLNEMKNFTTTCIV